MSKLEIQEIDGDLYLVKGGVKKGPFTRKLRDLVNWARFFQIPPSKAHVTYLEFRLKEANK